MTNEMILASAGSGKTWQLTNRYIAIMARDLLAGAEPRPERILAATFTRKAAGEFFDEILKKLAKGATSPEDAADLAGRPHDDENPLYPLLSQLTVEHYRQLLVIFVQRMPRLFLGTLDSLFSNIVRSFPAEFGLAGDFDILDDHATTLARNDVFRRVFEQTSEEGGESDFLEAFRLATFGKEESSVQSLLDNFIGEHHDIFLSAGHLALWGNEKRIWPQGSPWLFSQGSHHDDLEKLFALFEAQDLQEKQWIFWEEFRSELLAHNPGNALPNRVNFFLEKFLACWDEFQEGEADFKVNRLKQSFLGETCELVCNITKRIVGDELRSHLTRTRGLWALLNQYEETYSRQVRRRGHLTFHDLEVILAGTPTAPAPILTQSPADDARLRIDYRLDATFHHWLLDEFQDTSYLQWSVIENLVDEVMQDQSADRSLFQVGDIKQAIYAWRGGDTRLFKEIFHRYSGEHERALQSRPLNISWRSGRDVIEPLNEIFGNKAGIASLELPPAAQQRWEWQEHRVAPPNQGFPGFTAYYQPTEKEGARWSDSDCFPLVVALLEEIQPTKNGRSCAILVQNNKVGRELVDYIRTHSPSRIPVVSESDIAIAKDNPVTLAFLSLFHLAAHPGDDFALGHVAMSPLQKVLDEKELSPNALSRLLLRQIHQDGFESTLQHWIALVTAYDLLDDSFSRQRLQELSLAARLFDDSGRLSIDSFLQFARSYTLREPSSQQAVQVMTIHKSKGLTFDLAILPQLGGNSLKSPRRDLGVKRNSQDRTVEWVYDIPRKAIAQADPVLADYRTELEAEAGYEELCKFYVGLTRARYANYLIAPPRGKTSMSLNFIKLLDDSLTESEPSDESIQGVPCKIVYESELPTSQKDWWNHLPEKKKTAAPEAQSTSPATLPTRIRPARQTPSFAQRDRSSRQIFARRESAALALGCEVHALFQQIEWWQPGQELPSTSNPHAQAMLETTLADSDCSQLLSRPQTQPEHTAKLWREQSFEVLLGGRWTTGIIDRAHLIFDKNGNPISAHLIDFKTDEVADEAAAREKANNYKEQIQTYRAACAVLFGIPQEKIQASLLFARLPLLIESRA